MKGRIGKISITLSVTDSEVQFHKNDTLHKEMKKVWFVYVQRVSKRLKDCDIIFFDGVTLIEFTTSQEHIDTICDLIQCEVYIGGLDPLPWKRFLRNATKFKWQLEDWQQLFEVEDCEEEDDEDEEWKPGSESSDDDEESSDEDEDERPAKRQRIIVDEPKQTEEVVEQTSPVPIIE